MKPARRRLFCRTTANDPPERLSGGEGAVTLPAKPYSPELLTEAEAAARLRVCTKTLRKERKAGRLTFILIRGAIRYSPEDIADFIEKARQCPSTNDQAPRTGNTTSRSTVSDFAEALARRERGKRDK